MDIDCTHWRRPGNGSQVGTCAIGRFGGRPSPGCCAKCTDRNEENARAYQIPDEATAQSPRMAPIVAQRAARNTAVCESCSFHGGVNPNGTIRCRSQKNSCECGIQPWSSANCPEGLWQHASNVHAPQNLMFKGNGGQLASLHDMFATRGPGGLRGQSCFLLCPGPSLDRMELVPLMEPGFLTMSMNNGPDVFRPNLWCAVDGNEGTGENDRFLPWIFQDPGIMKFYPVRHLHTVQGPNLWGYTETQPFRWWRYLAEQRVVWGNNVMMICIRILYDLGVRTIYVLGADFHMDAQEPYAFRETVNDQHARSNNVSYEMMNRRFVLLRPLLEQHGLKIFNCTPGGNLTAFERMGYDQAIDQLDKPDQASTWGRYTGTKHLRSQDAPVGSHTEA